MSALLPGQQARKLHLSHAHHHFVFFYMVLIFLVVYMFSKIVTFLYTSIILRQFCLKCKQHRPLDQLSSPEESLNTTEHTAPVVLGLKFSLSIGT